MNRTNKIKMDAGWEVQAIVDEDGHINVFVKNIDGSDVFEVETGQGDGENGDALAFRLTTAQKEAVAKANGEKS
jgi:hypothetical protein